MAVEEGEKCLNDISSQPEWVYERAVRILIIDITILLLSVTYSYKHGGGGGIRTLAATFGHPTGLAIPPLQPLGYPTIVYAWIVWKVCSGANFYSSSSVGSSSVSLSSSFLITISSSSPSSSKPISTIFSCSSFLVSRKWISVLISLSSKSDQNKSA